MNETQAQRLLDYAVAHNLELFTLIEIVSNFTGGELPSLSRDLAFKLGKLYPFDPSYIYSAFKSKDSKG